MQLKTKKEDITSKAYEEATLLISVLDLGYSLKNMKNRADKTDWTSYYSGKKSIFSTVTQRHTLKKIERAYDFCKNQKETDSNISVLELGGGNSCFVEAFCKSKTPYRYDIVDNNRLAVELFDKKQIEGVRMTSSHLVDLTSDCQQTFSDEYDFVYSIGLIEHFSSQDRQKVIENHFRYCKDEGVVYITFPTPTFRYLFWRKLMELCHVWKFHDEIPLTMGDVKDVLEQNGIIVHYEINKKIFLTQMCVLVVKEKK